MNKCSDKEHENTNRERMVERKMRVNMEGDGEEVSISKIYY